MSRFWWNNDSNQVTNKMIQKVLSMAAATAALTVGVVAAADVESGLQLGDTAVAFHVDDVTGPRQGHSLCYACAYGKHRVVNIQATRVSDALIQLIADLDGLVDSASAIRGDSVHAFVVLLTEDPDLAEEELQAIARDRDLTNIPLTIYDELSGPPPYRISRDAEVTIMMWNNTKVTTNHAFAAGCFDKAAAATVLRDAKQHLGRE